MSGLRFAKRQKVEIIFELQEKKLWRLIRARDSRDYKAICRPAALANLNSFSFSSVEKFRWKVFVANFLYFDCFIYLFDSDSTYKFFSTWRKLSVQCLLILRVEKHQKSIETICTHGLWFNFLESAFWTRVGLFAARSELLRWWFMKIKLCTWCETSCNWYMHSTRQRLINLLNSINLASSNKRRQKPKIYHSFSLRCFLPYN